MQSSLDRGLRMPSRMLLAALGWTLLAALAIVWAVSTDTSRVREESAALVQERELTSAARHASRAFQLALVLEDAALASEVATALVDEEPGVAGVVVEFPNGARASAGTTASESEATLPYRRTPVHGPAVNADLLFFGDRHRAETARPHDLGTVTVYGPQLRVSATTYAVRGWRIPVTLCAVLLGYLMLAVWIRRRIRCLTQVANALASGHLDDVPQVRGRDEVAWASRSLANLRVVLSEQMASVRDRNADLLRDATLASDRLDRISTFAARLVAPLSEESALGEATRSLALHTDAAFALLFTPNPALGELGCEAMHGLSARLEDPRFSRGLEHASLSADLNATRPLPTLDVSHPWMQIGNRSIPHEGAIAVPLWLRGELQGIVVVVRREPFSDSDERFLADAAGPFAIALANRSAYEATVAMKRVLQGKNDELLAQRDQLEVVDRMRAQFAANMSHELRTPINAIIGYTELIADGCFGATTNEQAEPLRSVLEASASLLHLVNQVLDLSAAEAEHGQMDLEWCDALEVAQEVARLNAPACRDKPFDVTVSGSSVSVETDAQRLRQVLNNLVGNAVKFTQEGSVQLIVIPQADGGVHVVVEDTGIGIPASHLELIFDEFRQVDGSSTRSFDGVGLGLAISRRFAAALGGTLEVSSSPGRGTRFTLLLPVRAPKTALPETSGAETTSGLAQAS